MMGTSSSVDCGARILLPLDQVEAGEQSDLDWQQALDAIVRRGATAA
jgi:hypothetical protein